MMEFNPAANYLFIYLLTQLLPLMDKKEGGMYGGGRYQKHAVERV